MSGFLDKAEDAARFYVALGYGDEVVRDSLLQDFPDCDPDLAIEQAKAHVAKQQAGIDALIKKDGDAAVAAEHDLDKTMHDDRSSQ